MTSTRSLRRDDRGQSPYVLVASIMVFVIVSVGVAAGLIASLQASTATQVAAQLEETASTAVRTPIRQGYNAVLALPAEEQIPFTVGVFEGTALRTVEVNTTARTARVTVTAPKFTGSEFRDPAVCEHAPDTCITVSEMVSGAGYEVTP